MRQLPKKQKEELLSRLYWDMNIDTGLLYKILQEETPPSAHIDKTSFYCRLLTTYDWYTPLKLVPKKKLREMLSNQVINRLYPKELRKRFLYARDVLSG